MKTRLIIAVMLFILIFGGIGFCFGLAGIYCKQLFSGNVPLICIDEQPDTPVLLIGALDLLGWILLISVPTTTAVLYARFGWPRIPNKHSE
jgi:hypothetical protein